MGDGQVFRKWGRQDMNSGLEIVNEFENFTFKIQVPSLPSGKGGTGEKAH